MLRNEATLKVGVIAGPEAETDERCKKAGRAEGLSLEVIEFNDYTLPNLALLDGSIDANIFQHQPYLDAFKAHYQTTI